MPRFQHPFPRVALLHEFALPVVLLAVFSLAVSLLCRILAGWLCVPACAHTMAGGSGVAPSCGVEHWLARLVWRRCGFIRTRIVMTGPANQITGRRDGALFGYLASVARRHSPRLLAATGDSL